MFIFDDIMLYAGIIGGAAVGGEILNYFIKQDKEKLATGKLGDIKSMKDILGKDGLRLGKKVQLSRKASFVNVAVIGPTESRKSTSLFYPQLLTEDLGKSSLIILDSKGELYRDTANYQRSIGRKPILFSPLSPLTSYKYNVLEQAKDITEVREIAQTILINGCKAIQLTTGESGGNDSTWINMALPLFVASLLYVKSQGKPMNTVTEAVRLVINHSNENLELLFKYSSKEIQEQFNIFKTSLESPKTAASIKVTLGTNLQIFLDNNLIKSTSETEFTAEQIREQPTALYLSYNDRQSVYLSPFLSVFYSQIISHLMDSYSDKSIPVYFLFDEFASSGAISNFHNTISVSRSRELSFLICLQSISQLYQLYGKENALTILNNAKTKCVLPGISDVGTLHYISELCGDTEVKTKTVSNNNTTHGTTTKRLLNSAEVRELGSEEILIVSHNFKPMKDKQNRYYENEEYTQYVYQEEPEER